MALAARLPLAAWRYELCVRTIRIVGLDLTDWAAAGKVRAQVRLRPDTPGAALIDLTTVTTASAEGIKLENVEVAGGVPTSVLTLRINKTTMESLPYSGEIGDDSQFWWALQLNGVTRNFAEFWALANVMDSSGAPLDRPSSYGSRTSAPAAWSAASLTFSDQTISVSIDGADVLSYFAAQAEGFRDDASDSATAAAQARDIAQAAVGVDYPDEATALASASNGERFTYWSGDDIIYAKMAGGVIVPLLGPWFSSDKIRGLPVLATDRGLKGDGVTDDQAAMTALLADPTAKVIRFPPGVYRAYLANSRSNRTFIFDEGAIIDGTIHLATGGGPDATGPEGTPITWCENVLVIGTVCSTVRIGTYYCRRVHVPKMRITGVNPAYANQTAEGGTNGVHLYVGTKDTFVGEIIIESATDGVYALGIDIANTARAGGDYAPENISIGRVVVRNNTQSILSTNGTIGLTIGEIDADSWDTYNAMSLTADTDLRIGKITAAGSPITPNRDGIYVLNGFSASFGDIDIVGSTQIGVRTFNCGRVDVDVIRSSGNALDQVRIESPGVIGRIETSDGGTGLGVNILGNANGLQVRSISDDAGGVTVTADDVVVNRLVSKNNLAAGKYGLFLSGADRFVNDYLLVDNNAQGLRMTNVADPTFGDMFIRNNTSGIIGSAVTGLAYRTVSYSGNGTDTNLTLNTVPGFKGSLVRQSVASLGDADVALTVGSSAVTQVCATSLTSNRTVTLPTTGVRNGDKFRICRTAASGGSFTLGVTAIGGLGTVNLATGQWLEVEYVSGWQMTAKGSLV